MGVGGRDFFHIKKDDKFSSEKSEGKGRVLSEVLRIMHGLQQANCWLLLALSPHPRKRQHLIKLKGSKFRTDERKSFPHNV